MSHFPSTTETLIVRGVRYNIRHWGSPGAPTLFFLHGRMDSSATFQFVVDALQQDWHIIAPDWRGFGASEWLSRPYWFHDYYADFDLLLDHFSAHESARVVGHSMGANIAAIYAGVRPERIKQLVMLDFLGLKPSDSSAHTVLAEWLSALREQPRVRSYPDHAALAKRLKASNTRLDAEKADFLARNTSRINGEGQIEMACDPWHKIPSPQPYRADEVKTIWQQVEAPVLMLVAEQGYVNQRFGKLPDEYQSRIGCFRNVSVETIPDSGHNIQHDQPEQVARAIEGFFER